MDILLTSARPGILDFSVDTVNNSALRNILVSNYTRIGCNSRISAEQRGYTAGTRPSPREGSGHGPKPGRPTDTLARSTM